MALICGLQANYESAEAGEKRRERGNFRNFFDMMKRSICAICVRRNLSSITNTYSLAWQFFFLHFSAKWVNFVLWVKQIRLKENWRRNHLRRVTGDVKNHSVATQAKPSRNTTSRSRCYEVVITFWCPHNVSLTSCLIPWFYFILAPDIFRIAYVWNF